MRKLNLDPATELAAEQHGVVTRQQLLTAGLTSRQIGSRIRVGTLRRLHSGVYLLGHLAGRLQPDRASVMAAALAAGPGALVSHRHAAALWDLGPDPAPRGPVHVVLPPGRTPTRRPGVTAHRAGDLRPGDVATVDRIPVTAPARTLADLATVASRRELERAVARAERLGLIGSGEMESLAARRQGRPGGPLLRALADHGAAPAFTRSEAERRFLDLIRGTGLPEPEVNIVVRGHEVDFLWRPYQLAVEIDGFAYHRSRQSFAGDRRRDADLLTGAGIRVIRFTWEQITREPGATLVTIARALAPALVDG